MHRTPGVFGTVLSIIGNSITLSSKAFGKNTTATTYTVDASNATVMKNKATSNVSAIVVGDTLMVQGTVSSNTVTATLIRDLPAQAAGGMRGFGKPKGPTIQGNGEPVVGGTVSAVNASTFTLTNKAGVTYAVDASNAFIEKGNATSSLSAVSVGDGVLVQGGVNGTSIVASSMIDQGMPSSMQNGNAAIPKGGFESFFGNFFRSHFGFF